MASVGNTPQKETKQRGERLFEGRVLALDKDIVLLENGEEAYREVIRHKGAVCVVPFDSEGNVILVHQYRYAVSQIMTEIPAGKLDSIDEVPDQAALRELEEETGYKANRLVSLGVYLGSPAILDEKIYMYAALDLTHGADHPDVGEYLSVEKIKLEDAVELVLAGEIPDGKTQVALLRLYEMKQRGRL